MTIQDVEVVIFDENMDPCGRIRNAESFTFTENWYEPHTWELKIDASKIDLYQLMTDIQTQHHIGFLSDDGTVKIGIIEDVKKPSGASGEQWTISGRGILALLERRKLMNGYSTSTGFDVQTAVAYETAMRYYVNNNCIAAKGPAGTSDTNRNITGLSLAAVDFLRPILSQYPPVQSDTYVKATTKQDTSYWPHYATDPSKSLIGGCESVSWISIGKTNQRFHIDLGSEKLIERIYYENMHYSGLYIDQGVKSFTLWGSDTQASFAELTYGTDTGWTQITTSQSTFDKHVALDQADPKYITLTNTIPYRYYAFKFADSWGSTSWDWMGVRRIELQIVPCNFQGRGQSLLDTLVEFNKSSQLSCDLVWSGAAAAPTARYTFVFTVYASTDLSDEVVLTADLGNVLSYDYQESVLGYRNTIYVAGSGDAAARVLSKIYTGAEPTGRDRFEDYIDATDCTTTDQLTQRGNETLTLKAGTESLEFEFDTENQSEVYGVDFKCGDIVTVIDPDVATLVDRITSVTTTYDENGKTIKLGMGTSAPDLVSIMKMDRKQNTGVRR